MRDARKDGRRRDVAALGVLVVAAGSGAALGRRWWAHRLTRRATGTGPGIRTDDGVLLHLESEGPADAGLTVVLVHGFAARADEFRAQRRALAAHARVVAFDQRGHGSSGWGGHSGSTLSRLARDLAEVIEQRTSGPVVLVAHSMGGMAVMALASERPELVSSTVAGVALISTSAGHLARTELPSTAARVLVRAGVVRALFFVDWVVAPLVEAAQPFRRRWGRQWLRQRLFGEDDPTPDQMERMLDMWESTPRSVTASLYPALVEHHRRDALEVFAGKPAVVLTGTHDSTIPARHSRRIAETLGPTARLVEVSGAGHMVNMTHADVVNGELLALLRHVRQERVGDVRDAARTRPGEDRGRRRSGSLRTAHDEEPHR